MERKFIGAMGTLILAFAISGCVAIPARSRGDAQVGSALLGGLGGYALTGSPAGVVVGAFTGLVIGNELQRYMDATDQRRVYDVTRRGILLPPHGQYHEDRWQRGQYSYHARIDPGIYFTEEAYTCRKYEQVTNVYSSRTGEVVGTRTHRGTACLDHHGEWVIRN